MQSDVRVGFISFYQCNVFIVILSSNFFHFVFQRAFQLL